MTGRTERATKKRRREAAAERTPPWSDLRLDALPSGPDKERVLLATRCFDAGDYAQVRTLADELGKSENEGVRKAADALRARIGIDKVQVAIFAACLALFLFVALRYLL